ncbi:diguanylate cyclase [Geomonas sp. RF6]|uniref:diguanylate cyclase n=1 Tax=Geomonas sp. RF6 TaxID=2897342 RepID=UPI001E552383|nr:diguanylate cyclase [Geomonas sp. RF6]UFS70586.1 diguanylate cyclase [Geomonas sp. RF6]
MNSFQRLNLQAQLPQLGRVRVKRVDVLFISALLLLTIMLFVSYQIKTRLADSNRWTAHTYTVLERLDDLHGFLLEAQSARRAYVLTRNKQYKLHYQFSAEKIPPVVATLRELTRDNTVQQQRLVKLGYMIDRKMHILQTSIDVMEKEGYNAAVQAQITEEGSVVMSMIALDINKMKDHEENLLKERRAAEQTSVLYLLVVVWGGILAAMLMLSLTYLVARREAVTHARLAGALESSNRDIRNLSEMTQFLQSSGTLAEAHDILSRYGARIFSGDSGGIYLLNPSKNLVVEAAGWGGAHTDQFGPEQCWGLRLGQPHIATADADVRCPHCDAISASICIPLAAQHETMGVLHIGLTSPVSVAALEEKHQMAVTFAEQVALALRNLLLREQLKELSIRDPLTALLNRRFMEESIQKELARATRKKLPLCLVMMDVDHFKNFNDTFGHEAGDYVLKEFGHILNTLTRESDIACRFGGEEFILIMPETSRSLALEKANTIREGIKGLQLAFGKQQLGKVTISAGVASFPENGDAFEHLLGAADTALYRAKSLGRDRVEVG